MALVALNAAADRLDRSSHAAVPSEHAIGDRNDTDIWRRGRRTAAQLARELGLVAAWVERADRHEGARGRAADARIAMHHDRRSAIPVAHELQEFGDMLLGRRRVA